MPRYSPRTVGAGFLTLATLCASVLALLWFATPSVGHDRHGLLLFAATPGDDSGSGGQAAGQGALIVGCGSLVGMLVNAIVADRKARADAAALVAVRKVDADERFAALQLRSVEQLADARVEIAGLKAQLDAERAFRGATPS